MHSDLIHPHFRLLHREVDLERLAKERQTNPGDTLR
jgi:hypothetical protein